MSRAEYSEVIRKKTATLFAVAMSGAAYLQGMDEEMVEQLNRMGTLLGISYQMNTLRRNLRDVVKDAYGNPDYVRADAIYDVLQGEYNRQQAKLNLESAEIKQPYADMKINSAEDAYIQMLGEVRYNPDTELTQEVMDEYYEKHKKKIDMDKVEPGRRYPMTFAIDDDIFNVYFIFYGPETIKVKGLGTVKTIRFAAKLLAGEVFTGEEDMMIWISDDENRVPVYFEAPILVGTASGRMSGCSGLKYPFSALIDKKWK